MNNYKPRISNEAVQKATGKSFSEWSLLLDKQGAVEWSHKQIVAFLTQHQVSGWWSQSITVEYEKSKGKRVLGQTSDADFQSGVSKTYDVKPHEMWRILLSPPGLATWFGTIDHLSLEKKAPYITQEGTTGEVRSVVEGEKLRLTWKPVDWEASSTIQIYLYDKGDKTTVTFHHERLASSMQREKMLARWKQVSLELERLI